MLRYVVCAALFLGVIPAVTSAGLAGRTGKEEGLWKPGQLCVVIGGIRNIGGDQDDTSLRHARFTPTATLAGSFDPSACVEIPVRFHVGLFATSIHETPPEGATIMAVLEFHEENGKVSGFIVSDLCAFMPGESSLVVLTGLADPKIPETLGKIRAARRAAKPGGAPGVERGAQKREAAEVNS